MKNYPHFVDINRDGVFAKVFTTPSGNEEFCSPTGQELRNSNTVNQMCKTLKNKITQLTFPY